MTLRVYFDTEVRDWRVGACRRRDCRPGTFGVAARLGPLVLVATGRLP